MKRRVVAVSLGTVVLACAGPRPPSAPTPAAAAPSSSTAAAPAATAAPVPWRICAPPAAVAPAGRVRIDGWFGPTVNDSLVLVVNGREQWRGLYVLCSDERAAAAGSSSTTTWRLAATDSIRSVDVIHGDTVRRTFHIGGARPSAMLIEIAPR